MLHLCQLTPASTPGECDHHVVTSGPQDFAVLDPPLPVIVVWSGAASTLAFSISALNALRETQLDHAREMCEGFAEMPEGFAMQATGMAQITALLTMIAGSESLD